MQSRKDSLVLIAYPLQVDRNLYIRIKLGTCLWGIIISSKEVNGLCDYAKTQTIPTVNVTLAKNSPKCQTFPTCLQILTNAEAWSFWWLS